MISRWLRTARHLRPSQILWRLRYAAERRAPLAIRRAYGSLAWRPPDRLSLRDDFPALPRRPSSKLGKIDLQALEAGVFEHLGKRVEIGRARPDWRLGPRSKDRLWTVTLHYHLWVAALAEAAAGEEGDRADTAALLLPHYAGDWIRRCPWDRPGAAALAWNAYAIATRLESWIRAYLAGRSRVFEPSPEFEDAFLRSLWQQAAYLNDHVEWDLRGNHLLRDALGLAWAGRFFDGPRPRAWLQQATDLAVAQVTEQVLADGGHFERSPGYHVEVMEDLLLLASLLEAPAARAKLRQTWGSMAQYLAWMRHPDGDVPLFNDGSLRDAGAVDELFGLGARIGVDVDTAPSAATPRRDGRHFEDSGMAVWHGDLWSFFVDLGSVGPDVQPGHAHADTLTFEASCAGRRLFVDPGTYAYDDDSRRAYDRGTAAHNTVCVDSADSSEMWQIFRVGRRARVPEAGVIFADSGMITTGVHDGYRHLPGRPRHQRSVAVFDTGAVMLRDRVKGVGVHRVSGGLLVEPSWSVEETADGWRLAGGDHRLKVTVESAQGVERSTEQRPYHPRYGVEQRATRIGWSWQGELPLKVTIQIWLE